MAGVAKRLRPRIVVPVFVGSNPIIRPIFVFWQLTQDFKVWMQLVELHFVFILELSNSGQWFFLAKALRSVFYGFVAIMEQPFQWVK